MHRWTAGLVEGMACRQPAAQWESCVPMPCQEQCGKLAEAASRLLGMLVQVGQQALV